MTINSGEILCRYYHRKENMGLYVHSQPGPRLKALTTNQAHAETLTAAKAEMDRRRREREWCKGWCAACVCRL